MTRDDIFKEIANIMNETFEIPLENIQLEANLQEDLDLDSIDAVDLIVKLQNYTNERINPEDFKQVRTVEDVVSAIEKITASSEK